jgi:hypothetical protein
MFSRKEGHLINPSKINLHRRARGERRENSTDRNFQIPPFPPLAKGSCEKIKKRGGKWKKMLDYTYNYMLSSFYPTWRRRPFPWDT